MAWGGESLIGYIRVELWAEQQGPGHPSVQYLVTCRTNGKGNRFCGNMVRLPGDLAAGPGPWQAFVRTQDDIEKYGTSFPEVVATVSPAGVLRLYEFCANDAKLACDLKPIH